MSVSKVAKMSDIEIFDLQSGEALSQRANDPAYKKTVNRYVSTYYTIDVNETLTKLTQVGKLVQLAYASSKGFNCNVTIVEILNNYQNFIKETAVVTATFVEVSLQALKLHVYALKFIERERTDVAIKQLSKCETIASRMEKESERLVELADSLTNNAQQALIDATKDFNGTEEEKKKMIEQSKRFQEDLAKTKSKVEELTKAVDDARKEEESADKKGMTFGIIGMVGSFVPTVGSGVSKAFGDKSAEYVKKAEAAHQTKIKLQAEERESNGNMKKLILQLYNSKTSTNELQKSIQSLEVTIKSLGKIKTIFLNAKMFWIGVEKQCKELANKDFEDFADFADMLKDSVDESAYCWLALGKINYDAKVAMRKASDGVDGIMEDLPTKEEAVELISTLKKEILADIETQDEHMKKDLAASAEKIKIAKESLAIKGN